MRWTLKPKPDPIKMDALKKALQVDDTIAALLVQRGIDTYEAAKHFFRPSISDLHDPFLMKDTPISTIMTSKGQKLILVYDFLKMWCFLIELVEILPETYKEPELLFSMGLAPDEDSKEVELGGMNMMATPDLGDDIDDIFSDFDEDEEDFQSFENIHDFDI